MFRKSRVGIWILLAILLLATVGTVGYLKKTYTIRTVYVEGNVHYTDEDIKSIVMNGLFGDNSLYLSLKYKDKGIEGIPFVDVVDVDILTPDTVKIIVYEKTLTGCVRYLDTYIYFDRDGYVVESADIKTAGVPQIMGLQFDHMITGEKLPVGNEDIFDSILSITQLLHKYALSSDKIYFNKSGAITLYFDEVKVSLGNDGTTLEDKLMILSELLPNLEGKSGILQMQTYDANSGKYVFRPE